MAVVDTKRFNAITTLLGDARSPRSSTTSARRVVIAARTLGLNDDEVRRLMSWLDYCDYDTGEPYSKSIKRVWP